MEKDSYWQKKFLLFAKCPKCSVFEHMHSKFAKNAFMTHQKFVPTNSLWVSKSAEFYGYSKFVKIHNGLSKNAEFYADQVTKNFSLKSFLAKTFL